MGSWMAFMWIPTKNHQPTDGARTRHYVLGTIAFLTLALVLTQVFLHQTSVGSPKFVGGTWVLWTATVLVILALLILVTVLGRNLIKLYFERRSRQVGSGFKTKIVSTFVALSLLPATLLFFLAYFLISSSIDQWFSAPAGQMLQYSRAIAEQYYQERQEQAQRFTGTVVASIVHDDVRVRDLQPRLEEACRQYEFSGAQVYDQTGEIAAEAGTRISTRDHEERIGQLVRDALQGANRFHLERIMPMDPFREVVWATAPIQDSAGNIVGALVTESLISKSMQFQVSSVKEGYEAYEQLRKEQNALRFTYIMILALSTLLIVFAFAWFAMYLTKRITGPIQALAEGAAAVSVGNLDYRVQCEAFDELGSLVDSFNRMTGELQENKTNIEAAQNSLRQTNVELDDRRRYIETILQTIATGVISLDNRFNIRTINRAAVQMLDIKGPIENLTLGQVLQTPASETMKMLLHKAAVLGPVIRDIELTLPGKTLHMATTVTPLVDGSGERSGWVIVMDDVTELIRAEKMTAWREVARRLAHEIKNPLTPIQLSAERILRRYRQIQQSTEKKPEWTEDRSHFESLVTECTRTITQEALSLKTLVDEFSRFARLPVARLQEEDVHEVLDNTLNLYNGRFVDVRLQKNFDSALPPLQLDVEQMKRVFRNLFDNALEAMADNAHAKILQVQTSKNSLKGSVRIEIADTGRGFPDEYQNSLFLPYFSTRRGGTGLGLAIVRQIVTEHHGQVSAEPNIPLGTRIVIDLPLAAN